MFCIDTNILIYYGPVNKRGCFRYGNLQRKAWIIISSVVLSFPHYAKVAAHRDDFSPPPETIDNFSTHFSTFEIKTVTPR